MRLSKVAKELNVGIANVVDHLASKGIEIDGRPNTKITPEAYELLKQQFMADVEQHKRSLEVAQERLEEKEAIKASVAVKSTQKEEVIKAKSDLTGPKMVGKIDVQPKATSSAKEEAPSDEVVEPATQAPASE
jgi:translation initiation factor IF-2